jgi:hypothetical protein
MWMRPVCVCVCVCVCVLCGREKDGETRGETVCAYVSCCGVRGCTRQAERPASRTLAVAAVAPALAAALLCPPPSTPGRGPTSGSRSSACRSALVEPTWGRGEGCAAPTGGARACACV